MVDSVRPLSRSVEEKAPAPQGKHTLWIKLENGGPRFEWLKKLLNMFPGKETAIVYLADSKKKLQTNCVIHEALIAERNEGLGPANVVIKH